MKEFFNNDMNTNLCITQLKRLSRTKLSLNKYYIYFKYCRKISPIKIMNKLVLEEIFNIFALIYKKNCPIFF